MNHYRWVAAFLFVTLMSLSAVAQEYVLVGWNDLGMHCSNKNFSKVVVLPPFNNVTAQLILKSPAGPPELVTSGYTVEYSIPNNTTSVTKTDFWTYAQTLFNLPAPLPADIGLTGKGLTGVLDPSGTAFTAHGIPVTPYADSDLVHETPFQLVHLVAKRTSDGTVLATTDAVIPVSNEVGCVQSGCHSSESQILSEHDDVSGFNRTGPVLCASCHASNALGTPGIAEARPFSYRMHDTHKEVAGAARSISTCYKCHPGPNTQCLRDVMGKNPTNPLVCQNCHGTMDSVASTILAGRRPWLDEPKCGSCHGAAYAEEPGKLFRQSTGHGGLMCSACHGSPHAILPTIQPNDNIQNIRLQGYAGTLRKCSVCHATPPGGPGPHGIMDTLLVTAPAAPGLMAPPDAIAGISTIPTFQWSGSPNASSFILQVAADSSFASMVWADSAITQRSATVPQLAAGQRYFWRIQASNSAGFSGWSDTWSFVTGSGITRVYDFRSSWNLVSLPLIPENAAVRGVFPTSVSGAYRYDPTRGYVLVDSLVAGTGYWIKLSGAGPLGLIGVPVTAETLSIVAGWNLIGTVADTVPVAAVQTNPPGLITSRFFRYDGGYVFSDSVVPARGYWVKAAGGGMAVISPRPVSPPGKPLTTDFRKFAKITVMNGDGAVRVLYLASRPPGDMNEFDLPPPAPGDGFDARFATGRFVDGPSSASDPEPRIRLSGISAPVNVEWELPEGFPAVVAGVNDETFRVDARSSSFTVGSPGDIRMRFASSGQSPAEFRLAQNTPNPFNPVTTVEYTVGEKSRVQVEVFDLLGKLVSVLVRREQEAGSYRVSWDASEFPSGIYFCRATAVSADHPSSRFTDTKKMLLIK